MRKVLYILAQLSDSDVEWLVQHGRKREVAARTVLIHEGRQIDTLYILLRGTLNVTGTYLTGPPIRLGAGEIVGEVSLLDSRPPIATVTAEESSLVLAIPRPKLLRKLETDTAFASHFYRALAVLLADRMRNTGRRLAYGKDQPLEDGVEYEDELSPEALEAVHVGGARFEHVLQRLLA